MPHLNLKQDIVKELKIKDEEKIYLKKNGEGTPEITFSRVNEILGSVDSIIKVKMQTQCKIKQDYDYLFLLIPQRIISTKGTEISQKMILNDNKSGKILAEVIG